MDTRHRNLPPPSPAGREDCWSEGATGALIDVWGDRYLQLSRGNLRQNDWAEVADAVNARQEALGRPRKTDVQCKNRIDTIKKKYKLEKSRPVPSQWPFFSRLDHLVGHASSAPKKATAFATKPRPGHPPLNFTFKNRSPNPIPTPAIYSGGSSSRSRLNSPVSSESSRDDSGRGGDDDDGFSEDEDDEGGLWWAARKRRRWVDFGGPEGGYGELARAVLKFAEIYEKVESSKQQLMLELERQRMEFSKDLEFQRMQMFMDAQLELEKMKRSKHASGSGAAVD